MCSAINSARTSSLVWIFFSSRAMRSCSGLTTAAVVGLEGGGSVLKELLLPAVEHRRLQRQLVAECSRPAPCPADAVSGWRPSLRLCSVSVLSSCVPSVSLPAERSSPFPAEAGQGQDGFTYCRCRADDRHLISGEGKCQNRTPLRERRGTIRLGSAKILCNNRR